MLPVSVPIASQLIHAAGIGYAMNYQDEKARVWICGRLAALRKETSTKRQLRFRLERPVVFVCKTTSLHFRFPSKCRPLYQSGSEEWP
jgi:TPP-dependent pyruvate/acetoin dehydrogenase alpha subunit